MHIACIICVEKTIVYKTFNGIYYPEKFLNNCKYKTYHGIISCGYNKVLRGNNHGNILNGYPI